jgi:hypothetical protein
MPAMSPVLQLGPEWLWGEAIGLLIALIPGQLLARWTIRGEHLAGRVALQVAAFGGFMLSPARQRHRGFRQHLDQPMDTAELAAQPDRTNSRDPRYCGIIRGPRIRHAWRRHARALRSPKAPRDYWHLRVYPESDAALGSHAAAAPRRSSAAFQARNGGCDGAHLRRRQLRDVQSSRSMVSAAWRERPRDSDCGDAFIARAHQNYL